MMNKVVKLAMQVLNNNKGSITLAVVFTFGFSVFGVSYQQMGYDVQRSYEDSGYVYVDLLDEQGHGFTVGSQETELNDIQASVVQELVPLFYGFNHAQINRMRIVFQGNSAQIVVVPSSFEFNGMDLSAYMPSGMFFIYDSSLEYDFRLRVDQYFLRFSGQYVSEDLFANKLIAAIENPSQAARNQDPQLLSQRIELQGQELEQALITLALVQTRTEALASEMSALSDEHQDLSSRYETFVNGVIALNNRGLFSGPSLPDEQEIARLIEVKQEHPEWGKAELLRALKDEGSSLRGSEVSVCLALFFNEFD